MFFVPIYCTFSDSYCNIPAYKVYRYSSNKVTIISQSLQKTAGPHSAVGDRCLTTDACLTADPGVASLIPAQSHTLVEIDYEIISTVILFPSADSFKKGCCQLQVKVYAQSTGQACTAR